MFGNKILFVIALSLSCSRCISGEPLSITPNITAGVIGRAEVALGSRLESKYQLFLNNPGIDHILFREFEIGSADELMQQVYGITVSLPDDPESESVIPPEVSDKLSVLTRHCLQLLPTRSLDLITSHKTKAAVILAFLFGKYDIFTYSSNQENDNVHYLLTKLCTIREFTCYSFLKSTDPDIITQCQSQISGLKKVIGRIGGIMKVSEVAHVNSLLMYLSRNVVYPPKITNTIVEGPPTNLPHDKF
ncbi:MAG: hypothetical protein LBJ92_03885 [Holosporales bacterium]|nr:hypothetical protein [Holosporales bacterium]